MTGVERIVWEVHGPDPLAFLQATTTQDHTGQAIGEPRWCATLDPNGRVLAFLRATPLDTETVLLDGEAACEPGIAWLSSIAPLSRCSITRSERVAAPVEHEVDEATRIAAGWPRYGIDVTDADLLNDTPLLALCTSFTKGCYRGQETVAKIANLGHARRAMVRARIEGDAVPDPGTEVLVEGAASGRVTSAAATADGVRALAIVRREHTEALATIAGASATLEPIVLAKLGETLAPPPPRPVSRAFGRR